MKNIRRFSALLLVFIFSPGLHAHEIYFQNDSVFVTTADHATVTSLDLSDMGLRKLPKNMGEFKALKKLDLSGNRLQKLSGLEALVGLQELVLDNNKSLLISDLGNSLSGLEELSKLSVSNSGIIYIPNSFFQISKLKELDLHSNKIKLLPSEIGRLKKLETLLVHNNQMTTVGSGIQELRQLKTLNLSGNKIENFDQLLLQLSSLNKLKVLELDHYALIEANFYLPIASVNELVVHEVGGKDNGEFLELFTAAKKLVLIGDATKEELERYNTALAELKVEELQIINHRIAELPNNLYEIKSLNQLMVQSSSLQHLSPSLNKCTGLQVVSVDDAERLDMTKVCAELIPLKKLKELHIHGNSSIEIPQNLAMLSELEVLKIDLLTVEMLPKNLKKLKNLKQLELYCTNDSIENLAYLKRHMPQCEFIWNRNEINFYDGVLNPPIANLDVSFDQYILNPSEKQEIVTPSMTRLLIPEDAFLDKNGKVVEGDIRILYREFNDPIDMAFAGIPMTTTVDGEEMYYSSAGMLEFRAYQRNEELFPNPAKPITVNYNSPFQGGQYDLYYLNEEDNGWENIGKDSIIQDSSISLLPDTTRSLDEFIVRPPIYPIPPYKKELVNLNIQYWKKSKSTYVKMSPKTISGKKRRRRDTSNKVFSEHKYLSKYNWVLDYDGDVKEKRKELEELSAYISRYNNRLRMNNRRGIEKDYDLELGMNLVDDYWIEPNPEADNFNLVISKAGELIYIPVVPSRLPSRPEVAQRKLKQIYSRYKRSLDQRRKDWETIDQKFDASFDDYVMSMETYELDYKQYQEDALNYTRRLREEIKTFPATENNIVRSFQLEQFGMFNYDIINKMVQPQPLLAKLVGEDGGSLSIQRMYVLDKDANGLISYDSHKKAYYDVKHTNSLIAILPNKKVGVLKSERFDPDALSKSTTITPLEIFDMNKTSITELRQYADFF